MDFDVLKDYDILDPNSKFYNDRCSSLDFIKSDKKYDMTLYQRKIYYFPWNVKLCPLDCKYLGIDQKTLSALCKCDFEEFPNVKYHDEYNEFEFDINVFKNSKKDSTFNFNIIKCASLIFNTKGIKKILYYNSNISS